MAEQANQDEINGIVWKACDTFRGAVDPSEYKNYILTMLFLKYLSDLWKDKTREYEEKYKGNAERVKRALGRERFVAAAGMRLRLPVFQARRPQHRRADQHRPGEDRGRQQVEAGKRLPQHRLQLEPALGQTKERNRRLKHLLNDFNDPRLDLRPSRIRHRDIIGDVYEYLIGKFAAGAGKKAGEFYTPPEVSTLLAKLVAPRPGNRICDPACGSGSLLIRVAKEVHDDSGQPSKNFSLFGQESNGSTWALCRMNMFLHEQDGARIEWCDTITNPKLVEDDRLMKFNVVVANPPFSLDKWGADFAGHDPHKRFWRGRRPRARATTPSLPT